MGSVEPGSPCQARAMFGADFSIAAFQPPGQVLGLHGPRNTQLPLPSFSLGYYRYRSSSRFSVFAVLARKLECGHTLCPVCERSILGLDSRANGAALFVGAF